MQTPPPIPSKPDDALSSLIPFRNIPALFAYYCGVFSLIPAIGMVLGLAALILGIVGLRVATDRPSAKGKVHAWIGIVVGGGIFLLHLVVIGMIVVEVRKNG